MAFAVLAGLVASGAANGLDRWASEHAMPFAGPPGATPTVLESIVPLLHATFHPLGIAVAAAVTLPKAYSGKHLPHPKAELLRGRVVSVAAEQPLPLQLDGEQPGTTPVRFEIVPGALRLRVPPA